VILKDIEAMGQVEKKKLTTVCGCNPLSNILQGLPAEQQKLSLLFG